MSGERWERVKDITADALERPPAERPSFVDQACHGDAEIAREVTRLLSQADRTETEFLSTLPVNLKQVLADQAPPLPCFTPGQTVSGRFRIIKFLNRGGMGEVYSAFDQELQEVVALKTIRPAIASIQAVTNRFKTEVRQTRRVTHGNVCRVYDLFLHEEPPAEPVWFLTMEFLEGQTLAERLNASGAMPLDQALPLIRDMVEALSAAHQQEIVHRDFKPANVMMIKESGVEKAMVTDFGLALSLSPSQTAEPLDKTEGTPAYMAPEQATGQPVTTATDQFPLGLVIAEMLTGTPLRPDRKDPQKLREQLDAWIRAQPKERLTPNAQEVIRRCLQFRPEDRFRDVSAIMPILDGTRDRRRRNRLAAALATVAAAVGLGAFLSAQDWGDRLTDVKRLTADSDLSGSPSLSLDGKWVVYVSDREGRGELHIWLQPASGGPARKISSRVAEDEVANISPDDKLVAFGAARDPRGIYIVGTDGQGERLLVAGNAHDPDFSPDGRTLVYWVGNQGEVAPPAQMYSIPVGGGAPTRLAANFADARDPIWSPDGQRVLFNGCLANIDDLWACMDWWTIRPDGTDARQTGAVPLLKARQIELKNPPTNAWAGDRVYTSGHHGGADKIWEIRLSRKDFRVSGKPRQVTFGTAADRSPTVVGGGQMAFGNTTGALHVWSIPLSGSDPPTRVTNDPGADCCPSTSADGRWLFFTRKVQEDRQLFQQDLQSGVETALTSSPGDKRSPVTSADGGRVAFAQRNAQGPTQLELFTKGRGVRTLCTGCIHPVSWYGEDRLIHVTARGEVAVLDVAGGQSRVVLRPRHAAVLEDADWSPSHEYLLFTSTTSQTARQIFAVKLPASAPTPTGEWLHLVPNAELASHPRWSRDGREFFYYSKRDGYLCIWRQSFDSQTGDTGEPSAVWHFHSNRVTPEDTAPAGRELSVGGGSIFANIGEVTQSVWTGVLQPPAPVNLFRKLLASR
jgi:serine/threonine protein kinase